jgi:hypothetical protein
MKKQFQAFWLSDDSAPFNVTRTRVAYLLYAARSRKSRVDKCNGAYLVDDTKMFILPA